MNDLATKARTALALGPVNILRVGLYRAGLKSGLHPAQRLNFTAVPEGEFFSAALPLPLPVAASPGWTNGHMLFDHLPLPASELPPDWHLSLASGQHADASSNWWQIADFDAALGDIKPVWELSRMAWLLPFAQAARNGDGKAVGLMNNWLADWLRKNPPYRGVNWKCGQEASIRVMHLAMAAHILGQMHSPAPALLALMDSHLRRIAPTLSYAKAQDNNHGTSEAAALFIGGVMLGAEGNKWRDMGRAALEERMAHIVLPDGSFSQQSLVYHRLLLDTLSMAELTRRIFNQPAFSSQLMDRAKAALLWMHALVDQANGDGPNLGANDSAQVLPMTALSSRDFRPSLQLAATLIADARAIEAAGPWDDALVWLGIPPSAHVLHRPCTRIADDGGFAVLRQGAAMALLRYPRFRFRPSQADVMHVDLWVAGHNWLTDAGTYSYNTEPQLMAYFSGTASHNTVQFDGRNQMPQLGRFLFGDWLTAEQAGPLQEKDGTVSFSASYVDGKGARHARAIALHANGLRVTDDVSGFQDRAILRWRLKTGDWSTQQTGTSVTVSSPDGFTLTVQASAPYKRAEIVEGWTSLHYLQKERVPVLEVEVRQPGQLLTEVTWPA